MRSNKRRQWVLSAATALVTGIAYSIVGIAPVAASPASGWTATPITADANTVLLDHFDDSTVGTAHGTLDYAPSLAGLDRAGVFGPGTYVQYHLDPSSALSGTVEMWVRPTGGLTTPTGLLNFNWNNTTSSPPNGWVLQLLILPSTTTPPNVVAGSSVTGDTPVALNQWTHIALTWSPASTKLYQNGVLTGTGVGSSPDIQWGTFVYLNYWGLSASGPFTGLIDELSISDIDRSAAEIAQDALLTDASAPEVTVTTPPDGASYYQGSTVDADFSVADPESGISTSTSTVDNAAPIDTSTLGAHSFTVSATNGAGLTTTVTNAYTVVLASTTTTLQVSPGTTVTYPQSLSLQATVAAVDSAAGTPTGSVDFVVDSDTYTVALAGGVATRTVTLGSGTHSVTVNYTGDVGFATSSSDPTGLTVDPAETSLVYGGAFWAYVGSTLGLRATVSCAGGVAGRTVTFTLTPAAGGAPVVVTAITTSAGVASVNASGLAAGEFDLSLAVGASTNCTAASQGDLVVTMVDPSASAAGGGWYQLPVNGQKRVNFGLTIKQRTPTTYTGNVLLIQTGRARIKGVITGYGRTGGTGVASGNGTLYTYDPLTYQWVNPVAVTFSLKFADHGTGKKVPPDTFGVTSISVSGTQLVSAPQPLRGGDIRVS